MASSYFSLWHNSSRKSSYRIYSCISRQFLVQFWRSSCGGRLIHGSRHTARVDSQHDGYLSSMLTHMAWTISRSLGLRGCMGRARRRDSEWLRTDLCCCCIVSHCNFTPSTPFQHSDHARPSFSHSHTQAVSWSHWHSAIDSDPGCTHSLSLISVTSWYAGH